MDLGSESQDNSHIHSKKFLAFKKIQTFLNVSRPSGIALSIPGASMIRLATLLAWVSRAKHSGASWWTSSQLYGIQISTRFLIKINGNHDFPMKIMIFHENKLLSTSHSSATNGSLEVFWHKNNMYSSSSLDCHRRKRSYGQRQERRSPQSALENMENHEKSWFSHENHDFSWK